MIICKLKGGLGNQMFQYATAKSLAMKLGVPYILDISSFEMENARNFALNHFEIDYGVVSNFNSFSTFKKYLNRFKHKYLFFEYQENVLQYNPDIFSLSKKNIVLDGYFQSEKYFIDIQEIIRSDFQLKQRPYPQIEKVLSIIQNENSVSIHIRRGDYLSNKMANSIHGICSLDYYIQAIRLINSKVKNPYFIIFSDDIKWAKSNLTFGDNSSLFVDFTDDTTNYLDVFMMSQCRHNIIANSSFSWWGAWLNDNSDKIVIAPVNWFADTSKNSNDIIPENWLKI